jgi:hypothetical protein
MRFAFEEEQLRFRDSVRGVLERICPPAAVRTVWEKELPDIRAMHLHPKDIGGAIVSIDQPVPAPSWRWGGPWRRQDGARGGFGVNGVALAALATQPPVRAGYLQHGHVLLVQVTGQARSGRHRCPRPRPG